MTVKSVVGGVERSCASVAGPGSVSRCDISAVDVHRLALQSVLTAGGVPPAANDAHAVAQISQLDEASVIAVIRWLRWAHS